MQTNLKHLDNKGISITKKCKRYYAFEDKVDQVTYFLKLGKLLN